MSTEQELNEFLAKEIMGWRIDDLNIDKHGYPSDLVWIKNNNKTIRVNNWNPLENLEQAFECLGEYCSQTVYHYDITNYLGQSVTLFEDKDEMGPRGECVFGQNRETREKSIISVILKAESKFEEFEECF